MAEYISREDYCEENCGKENRKGYKTCTNCGMLNVPATDVQPAKHGEWRKDEQGYDVYVECSECGLNLSTSNYIENEWREILKYCPCCGARMDGDAE